MIDLDLLVLGLRGILVFCLYAFLLFALVVVWRDTSDVSAGTGSELPSPPSARLVILEAADSGLAVGSEFLLVASGTVGRSEPNSVVIPDPAVSARHCRMSFRKGQWWIEDLGSANGTFVNGRPVAATTLLQDGDVVEVARVKLTMEIA